MLCIVCSRPLTIPIFQDENKVCKSCASQIKQGNSMKDIGTDSDRLEMVQRQLLLDLNLEDDSDYMAELNYLREVKRAAALNKEKNVQSFHPTEVFKEYHDHKELNKKTKILAKECVPEFSNVEHKQESPSSSKIDKQSFKNDQKLPQLLSSSPAIKEKANRRVAINRSVTFSTISIKKPDEDLNESQDGTFSIACRAVYRPTHKHQEPCAQFEKIQSVDLQSDSNAKTENLPMIGNKNPFICPVTFCKSIIPVSDILKHFKLNHIRVPIVPVVPGACTNLFWEAKADRVGTTQCLMVLLSTAKFKESGYGQFRDCLPVAIMTTKIKFSDLAEVECVEEDRRHFYMLWLTAMSSSIDPVFYTVAAWSGTDDALVHTVNSSQTYSVRADQNPKSVYGSGMAMILTSEQINRLSNNNQDMVKLQVVIH